MVYDKQIIQILHSVGEQGIGIRKLAKHVYNLNCTLFAQPDFQQVYAYVCRFLQKHSKTKGSPIARTGRRGYYRLNTRTAAARQLLAELGTEQKEPAEPAKEDKPQTDLSLNLFDF